MGVPSDSFQLNKRVVYPDSDPVHFAAPVLKLKQKVRIMAEQETDIDFSSPTISEQATETGCDKHVLCRDSVLLLARPCLKVILTN